MHRRVTSAERATALSLQSLALQLVAALSGVAITLLPAGPLPWLFGATALLAGALLWVRRAGAPGVSPSGAPVEPPGPVEAPRVTS